MCHYRSCLLYLYLKVRLWTLTGQYVGQFGQMLPWDISQVGQSSERPLPHDVRKVASSTTLMVLYYSYYCTSSYDYDHNLYLPFHL